MKKINLQNLQKHYNENLCNRTFHYELTNGEVIDVKFYVENLCHLLGLQHIYNHRKHYLGLSGYTKIKKYNITDEKIKKHNQSAYNFIKMRLAHFHEISTLMQQGKFLKFYQDRTRPISKIRADFVLYENNKEYILHLFLIRENINTNEYVPTSFVVKSKNDKTANQYMNNQEYKTIKNFEIFYNEK